ELRQSVYNKNDIASGEYINNFAKLMTLVDNNMPEDMIKNVNGDYLKTYIALITKTKNTAETLEKNKKMAIPYY
ncbi:hypothetical protein AB8P58_08525, partial [Yersinia enterocolitica]|uniref:hypothetical protein n=1 Tax=Yersinia enterocolitica TaxID=630 RepID=UPI0037CFDC27